MKLPRVSILALMAAVIVAAVDCMAFRSVESRSGLDWPFDMIVPCALPMLNVLAIGFASSLGRPGRRPFLRGFLLGGSIAVAAMIALVSLKREWIIDRLAVTFVPVLPDMSEDAYAGYFAVAQFVLMPAIFLVPQLLFALVGGVVGRVASRNRRDDLTDSPVAPRRRFLPLLSPLILVVLPFFAMEGYFRWKVDPAFERMAAGSAAIFRPDDARMWVNFRRAGGAALTDVTRVRIDGDDGPDELGNIQFVGSPRPQGAARSVRQVRVTLLDGPRRGESILLVRCLLRSTR